MTLIRFYILSSSITRSGVKEKTANQDRQNATYT